MALIHAKTGTGAKISASAFHQVVAQAMKNLVYLSRNAETPDGAGNWLRSAKWNKTGVSRLRASNGIPEAEQLWEKMKFEIIDSSNPALYVILVTAGCCDLKELREAVHTPAKRTPETAQLMHLLDGLNGYARQLGVRLALRDLPYHAT